MLKQLRAADSAGTELWEQHWRDFGIVRLDRAALKWDGILDIIDQRVPSGLTLEAGCGLGKYLLYMRQRGARAIGIDFAVDALQSLKARAPGTPVIAADLTQLPFRPGTFDTVLCFGVLEHFETGAEEHVWALGDLLRPGGWLVLTVPYANMLKRRMAERGNGHVVKPGQSPPPGLSFYQHCFTREEARHLVRRAGCELMRERRIARLFWLLAGRTNRTHPSHTPRSGPPAARSSPSLLRSVVRETAYLAQWLIPGDLTSHMIAVVGRKPGAARASQ